MPLITAYLHIVANNPNVAMLSIAGMLACFLGIGWCLRSLVCEWHIAHIDTVVRTAIGLHLGKCSLYFAREVMYS